jgi:hypothetical protein
MLPGLTRKERFSGTIKIIPFLRYDSRFSPRAAGQVDADIALALVEPTYAT